MLIFILKGIMFSSFLDWKVASSTSVIRVIPPIVRPFITSYDEYDCRVGYEIGANSDGLRPRNSSVPLRFQA